MINNLLVVGRAKNEAYELVFGNLLIGIGGLLSGMGFLDVELNYLIIWAIPIFTAGIILDVRVLRKFSFELNNVKKSILNQMNAINRNIMEIHETKEEIESTKDYLDSTMDDLTRTKEELEQLQSEIIPRNTVTNPDLMIRRFESIENYTMFDIDKQPILALYLKLVSVKPQTDLKSIQDFKLIKLLSMIYKLVWYNNSLLHYSGQKIKFEPLDTLMKKKNRLNRLCKLKIHESLGEINLELEQKMAYLVDICYNSMIDSQEMKIGLGDPDMIVKEHFVKVSEINEKFKQLVFEINDFLTTKFVEEECEKIANLKYNI